MEYLGSGSSILAITVFAKEDKDTKPRNEALQEKKQAARRGELKQDLSYVSILLFSFSCILELTPIFISYSGLTTAKKPFTWAARTFSLILEFIASPRADFLPLLR